MFRLPVLIKRLFEVMGIFPTVLVATVCTMVMVFPEQGNCKCSLEPDLLHRYFVLATLLHTKRNAEDMAKNTMRELED